MYLMLSWTPQTDAVRAAIVGVLDNDNYQLPNRLEPMGGCVLCNVQGSRDAFALESDLRGIVAADFSFVLVYVGRGHSILHSGHINDDEFNQISDH